MEQRAPQAEGQRELSELEGEHDITLVIGPNPFKFNLTERQSVGDSSGSSELRNPIGRADEHAFALWYVGHKSRIPACVQAARLVVVHAVVGSAELIDDAEAIGRIRRNHGRARLCRVEEAQTIGIVSRERALNLTERKEGIRHGCRVGRVAETSDVAILVGHRRLQVEAAAVGRPWDQWLLGQHDIRFEDGAVEKVEINEGDAQDEGAAEVEPADIVLAVEAAPAWT